MDSDNESSTRPSKSAPKAKTAQPFAKRDKPEQLARIAPPVLSLIERHSTRLTAPAPRHDTHPLVLPVANYIPWAESLYQSIINGIYSGYPVPLTVIQEGEFIAIVLILICEKTMLVHAYSANDRLAFRPRYINRVLMPTSLLHVLNGLGLHMVKNGAYQVYPAPDPTITQAYHDAHYADAAIPVMLSRFSQLINNATIKNCCTSGYADLSPHGNASWCLKVINAHTGAIADGSTPSVAVQSLFTEATTEDVVIAAIVQNRNDGLLLDPNTVIQYQWKTYSGVQGMREYFNTHP